MAIASTDILWKYSINTGPGNSTAQADPHDSLGGFMSSTQCGTALHQLFDVVTGDENAASDTEYRCVFVHNAHGTLTWENVKVWISAETAGGAAVAIALDQTGVVAAGSATAQAERVANEGTAPTGETFSSPTTEAAALTIGNIPAGSVQAIWIRRSAANTAAIDNDSATFRCKGDTAA